MTQTRPRRRPLTHQEKLAPVSYTHLTLPTNSVVERWGGGGA